MAKNKLPDNVMPLNAEDLPEVLRWLLYEQEVTMKEISQRAGVSASALQTWVSGLNYPRLDLLCYVMDAFGKQLVIIDK